MPTSVSSMPSFSKDALQHPEQIERMDVRHRPGTGGEPFVAARHFEEPVGEVLYFVGDDLLEGGAVRVLELRIGEQVSAAALRSPADDAIPPLSRAGWRRATPGSRSADRCRRMTEHSRTAP